MLRGNIVSGVVGCAMCWLEIKLYIMDWGDEVPQGLGRGNRELWSGMQEDLAVVLLTEA